MSCRLFTILLFLLIALPVWAKDPIRIIEGTVAKVCDGDSINVIDSLGTTVKVRLYGIDAPEKTKNNHKISRTSKPGQPYGEEAFDALKRKIEGQQVKVEVLEMNRNKRAVSVVWLGTRNINLEMLRDGFAWAYHQHLEGYHAPEYIQVEERAQKERRGLWQQNNPQPPWEFRKRLIADLFLKYVY